MLSPWKKVAAVAFVLAVAFGMRLPAVHAGQVVTANFKMPFDAAFGEKVLATGDYTFAVNPFGLHDTVVIYQGTKGVALLRAELFDRYENKGEKAEMIFVRHDGNATLRALRFPGEGTFYFHLSKELKTLVAQQPQLIETIAIKVSGD